MTTFPAAECRLLSREADRMVGVLQGRADTTKADKRRDAIWAQAEEMCVPAWATPLWRATYCKPAKA